MSTLFSSAVVPVFDEHLAVDLDVHAGQYRLDDVAREPVTTALNAHGVTDHEWVDATHFITSDNPNTIIPVTMIAAGDAPTSSAATIKPISKRPLTTTPRRVSSSRSLR